LNNRKKVILLIVEGSTDETTLALCLTRLAKNKRIHFYVVHGDITSDKSSNVQNILTKLYQMVDESIRRYKFLKSDIEQIVHLIDTDGAFINPSCVHRSTSGEQDILYFDDKIVCPNPEYIIERNSRKSVILEKLIGVGFISRIPYKIYFLSRNLEHALYKKINLEPDEKVRLAKRFQMQYADDLAGFCECFSNSEIAVKGDYITTWEYIKQDCNSLLPASNFHLFVESVLDTDST
jgi:hypothetical protein